MIEKKDSQEYFPCQRVRKYLSFGTIHQRQRVSALESFLPENDGRVHVGRSLAAS